MSRVQGLAKKAPSEKFPAVGRDKSMQPSSACPCMLCRRPRLGSPNLWSEWPADGGRSNTASWQGAESSRKAIRDKIWLGFEMLLIGLLNFLFVNWLRSVGAIHTHTYISTKPVTNPSKFKYGRKDVDRASMLCMRIRRRWTTGNGIHNPVRGLYTTACERGGRSS